MRLPCAFFITSAAAAPSFNSTSGPISGLSREIQPEQRVVEAFFGIPYAAPPTGENRFRAPQPAAAWPGVLNATEVAAACPQMEVTKKVAKQSEDCLYLNVHRPAGLTAPSPVMVWLHGGGWIMGDGDEKGRFDGGHLAARHDVIVVTVNYRLGALGFMALEELQKEDPDRSTGNMALQDQRAALKWVQANAESFGGDKAKVTLFGQSAGAFSVTWHLASPGSQGLFSAAIVDSGTSHTDWFFQPLDKSTAFYSEMATGLGCHPGSGRLACLRKVDSEKFVLTVAKMVAAVAGKWFNHTIPGLPHGIVPGGWPVMPFGATIDGSDAGLRADPLTMMQNGTFNRVPLIIGGNQNDGDIAAPLIPLGNLHPSFAMEPFLDQFLPNTTQKQAVLSTYTVDEFGSEIRRGARFFRDLIFQCSSRNVARAFNQAGQKVYLYDFAVDFGKLEMATIGDSHAMDIEFDWRNGLEKKGSNPKQHAEFVNASNAITCSWASFATCHAPRCPEPVRSCAGTEAVVPEWPQYNAVTQAYYSMRAAPVVKHIQEAKFPDDEVAPDRRCDLISEVKLTWGNERVSAPVTVLV